MKLSMKYFKNVDLFIKETSFSTNRYLLLFAKNTRFELNDFNDHKINFTAAVFPHIIVKDKIYTDGLISIKIEESMDMHFIYDISTYKFEEQIFNNARGVITILEGFCKYNEEFLTKLFNSLNVNTNIMGGASGVIEDGNKPVLFNNSGFFKSSAILVTLNVKINVSAKHGLSYLKGPYIVTSGEKNVIETIDYESAFDVYSRIVKEDCSITLTKENFLDVSKKYPVGIVKYKGEEIVRDLISFDGDKLVFVSELSRNSMINILKSKKDNLINAAKEAALEAHDGKDDCSIFMFNCIGRKEVLADRFQDEIDAVNEVCGSSSFIGVTTVGEIANKGNRYINFLNKTCVIGGICN